MGTQERKQRQLAEREKLFLERAWEMIQREGLLKLQMARLAAECDYAVGTLYLHFSSKEDLLVALAASRIGERIELFQRAASWQAPSRKRMFAILLADVLFAQRVPVFFELSQYVSTHTIWGAATDERRAAALTKSEPISEAVQAIVSDAIRAGDVNSHHLTGRELCSGLWAMCVGMHALVGTTGLLERQCEARPYQLLQLQAHALLNGLNWQPLMPVEDNVQQRQLMEEIMQELFPEFSLAATEAAPNHLAGNYGGSQHE